MKVSTPSLEYHQTRLEGGDSRRIVGGSSSIPKKLVRLFDSPPSSNSFLTSTLASWLHIYQQTSSSLATWAYGYNSIKDNFGYPWIGRSIKYPALENHRVHLGRGAGKFSILSLVYQYPIRGFNYPSYSGHIYSTNKHNSKLQTPDSRLQTPAGAICKYVGGVQGGDKTSAARRQTGPSPQTAYVSPMFLRGKMDEC